MNQVQTSGTLPSPEPGSRDMQVRELLESLSPTERQQTVAWFRNLTEKEKRDLRQTLAPLGKKERKKEVLALVGSGSKPEGMDDLRRKLGLPVQTPVPPLRIEARDPHIGRYTASGLNEARTRLPAAGEPAPAFELERIGGGTVSSQTLRGRPTVIETGSITCPVYRRKVNEMARLKKKYEGVAEFVLIYTVEAHPRGSVSPYSNREWVPRQNELEGYLKAQPANLEERRVLARELVEKVGEVLPVGVDTMDNRAWKAYGARANAAFVLGADGRILLSQEWADPEALDRLLESLVP